MLLVHDSATLTLFPMFSVASQISTLSVEFATYDCFFLEVQMWSSNNKNRDLS